MKPKELRNKTIPELRKLLLEMREKSRVVRFKIGTAEVKDVRQVKKIKRDIARILTMVNIKLKEDKNESKTGKQKE